MISSIEWIPAGVATANPKKYEMSSTEQELIELMQQKGNIDDIEAKIKESFSDNKKTSVKEVLKPASHDLPADLRMDEYSSDEDEGAALGRLLIDQSGPLTDEMVPEEEGEDIDEGEEDEQSTEAPMVNYDDDADSDSDSDDDLADVPDTREFTPVDVEGLESMALSHVGTNGAMYMDDLGEAEDDDSEAEDVRLTADDALVVVAKTEDDFASLEVHVYDQRRGNLYVHHDIPLPAYPLCLAHGQVSSAGTTGNFCAVGTFSPGIEIWNLDVLNALEPSCILGGEDTTMADELMRQEMMSGATGTKPPKRHPKSNGLRLGSHTDAIMSLSWNQIHRQVIASGSADCTVKLWDVTLAGADSDAECNAGTFTHHRDKVQSVIWHPKEGTLLATGGFDRNVALLDARTNGSDVKTVKISADCEALAWDPCHPEYLTVASEDGMITCWDVRNFQTSTPLWSFEANEFGGVSGLSYNAHVPGMMATCSVDKTVTLWDTCHQDGRPTANVAPRRCGSKDMCAGKLYTVAFYPSTPWLLGCGGSGNQLSLWDLSGEMTIQKKFRARMTDAGADPSASEEEPRQEEFDAMMASKVDEDGKNGQQSGGKRKKKAKGKRKAHRRGR